MSLLVAEAFELRPIERHKINHGVFRFGKYKGENIEDVAEHDKDYLVWVARNVTSTSKAKTVELIKELVGPEIALAEREELEVEERREEVKRDREAKRAAARHVGNVKERLDLTLKYTGNYDCGPESYGYGPASYRVLYFFEDLDGNAFVWSTTTGLRKRVHESETKEAKRVVYEDEHICSVAVEKGETIEVKATIKKHSEYKGMKQNELTRVKVKSNV